MKYKKSWTFLILISIAILLSISNSNVRAVDSAEAILKVSKANLQTTLNYYNRLSSCTAMPYNNLLDTIIYGESGGTCHLAKGRQIKNGNVQYFYDCYIPLNAAKSLGQQRYQKYEKLLEDVNKGELHYSYSSDEDMQITSQYCKLPKGIQFVNDNNM